MYALNLISTFLFNRISLLVLFKDKCHLTFIFSVLYAKICSLRVQVTVISFNATFNEISAIWRRSVFICGGNQSTRRKPSTCRQSLTNSITYRVCLAIHQHIITKANIRLPSVYILPYICPLLLYIVFCFFGHFHTKKIFYINKC